MKKFITYVTAASLLMGSMSTTAYGATFADIDTVTWSGFKPFIEEAARLKLMNGYDENGKKYCKPRNNVTYCEAVQLMYSIMKTYTRQDVSDATVTTWKYILSYYNIPDWAYNAVSYSLQNQILTTDDLEKLRNGTKAANREDVGVIFGKALDTISGYDIKSNAGLSYKDKAKVSAAAVPYLELLNRANLMVGDTDNNFNPKSNISRAEMAVLSVKTYDKLTEGTATTPEATTETTTAASVVNSMVMANGDLFISLKTANGTGLNLFGTKGKVTPRYNGAKISFSDIGAGDTVKVTYAGTNITALEVTYSVKGVMTQETFELVDITEKKVTVLDGSKEAEYRLDKNADVELNGKKSSVSKLQDALEDANYDVTLTLDADDYVLEIVAVMNANNPTEGYVTDVEDDEITIKAGSKEYTYPLVENPEIEYEGKTVKFSKFEDDYEDYNYQVSLKLNKDNLVDEIIIEFMEDEYSGTLTFINSSRIQFEAGDETYSYDLTEDVDVEIDGKNSTVTELRENFRSNKAYTVKVDVDRYNDVVEIIATSKYSGNNDGELKEITSSKIKIVVDDMTYTYDLANDVDVEINGKNRDVDDLKDYLGEYSFAVKLTFDDKGDVSGIEATLEEANEGELRDIVESADRMTIFAAGLTIDLTLASGVDVTLNDEEISLSELNNELDNTFGGSRIYVELSYNSSGKIKTVDAYWEDETGELKSVDRVDKTIEVKVGSKTETYDVDNSAAFVFKLSSAIDKDKYGSVSSYDKTLRGLNTFLRDCEDAGDDCMVALTLDGNDVVRIKATAE